METSENCNARASEIRCRSCGSTGNGRSLLISEVMFGLDVRFAYQECRECLSLNYADRHELSDHYPDDYYSISVDPRTAFRAGLSKWFATRLSESAVNGRGLLVGMTRVCVPVRKVRSLARILSGVVQARASGLSIVRALDVGTGSGVVPLCLSLSRNVVVTGIDPSMEVELKDEGLTLSRVDMSSLDGIWDLIMFNHSLEHIADPLGALVWTKEHLAANGRVLVRIPTVTSDAYARFGTDWYQIDAPRHQLIPSLDGLATLVHRAGFRIESLKGDSTTAQYYLSRFVAIGLPVTREESGQRKYRSAPMRGRITDLVRTVKVNRNCTSDQVSVVLTRT